MEVSFFFVPWYIHISIKTEIEFKNSSRIVLDWNLSFSSSNTHFIVFGSASSNKTPSDHTWQRITPDMLCHYNKYFVIKFSNPVKTSSKILLI